ncbi:MAG: SCP2 sterol-binding domain-containing protein [Anaerolineales bacterium]|nr:SCP2 sterol-binding domain-containing protein [Anaerolineales bacterium]
MADELTIEKLMGLMPKAFLPDKAVGVNALIQYHLSGEQAGDWIVTIKDGACTTAKGTVENPTLTLSADSKDYLDIITGKLNAMGAFAEGKVKLKGDLGVAMKMMDFFKLPA